MSKGSS